MDSGKFLKPIEMLEKESAVRVASEAARISENLPFQQIILDMQTSNQQIIQQLNATIGSLKEEIRLLEKSSKTRMRIEKFLEITSSFVFDNVFINTKRITALKQIRCPSFIFV
ncbi:hypothetical protein [Chryseobacterium sp.]|uniref:hypothetical protein n=1 Tax=Chryseobacterium sp. TaxID=1871047 RepID=UPI0031D99DC6